MLTIEQPPTINTGLAARLFDAFNRQQIVYCHWKSNEQLAAGLKGETDLDLLVERASFTAAVAILLQLGFKQAAVRWGPRTPGVLHLYAFDPAAAGLIHVHLYSHLLTGESLVKTHVLPCESMLLDKGDCIGQVRVPAKEAEAAMYVLRAFIKNGSLLHTLLHGRGGGHNQLAEFWFPAEGIDADSAYRVLHEHYPVVGRRLFTECYRALAEDRSATRKWLLGLRIRHCLRGSARHTYPARLLAYAGLISAKLRRIAHGKVKNKVLDSGGAVIAFIGADATGKSTLVAETARWLSSNLAVRTMHVGKPPGTWLTAPLHVLLPVARCLFPGQRHQARQAAEASPRKSSCDKPKNSTSLLYAIRAVSLAFERARLCAGFIVMRRRVKLSFATGIRRTHLGLPMAHACKSVAANEDGVLVCSTGWHDMSNVCMCGMRPGRRLAAERLDRNCQTQKPAAYESGQARRRQSGDSPSAVPRLEENRI